jgi:hypothetical protein
MKEGLARWVFRHDNIDQLHVIGCARSGTTMMHATMCAFENVEIHSAESSPEFPTLGPRVRISRAFRRRGIPASARKFFVTKRGWDWFERPEREVLLRRAERENLGLINIVRDPRDVLLSRHPHFERARFVSVDFWRKSIEGAEWLRERLEAGGRFVTVRYEDVVRQPRAIERAVSEAFGLQLRPGASIDRVEDSLKSSGAILVPAMEKAMHGVRNADAKSIGKWRTAEDQPEAELLADAAAAPLFQDFVQRYGYTG